MKSTFNGFPAKMQWFFRELREHNDRDWFEAHKDVYLECVKTPMEELTTLVMSAVSRFAPEHAGEPKKAIIRIYRDTRYSHDTTPGPDQLRLIRSHIAENATRFEKLVTSRALVASLGPLQGEKLSRPPKGFDPGTPGGEYLKAKQWYHYIELDADLALSGSIVDELTSRFKQLLPMVQFLNEPLLANAKRNAPMTTGWF